MKSIVSTLESYRLETFESSKFTDTEVNEVLKALPVVCDVIKGTVEGKLQNTVIGFSPVAARKWVQTGKTVRAGYDIQLKEMEVTLSKPSHYAIENEICEEPFYMAVVVFDGIKRTPTKREPAAVVMGNAVISDTVFGTFVQKLFDMYQKSAEEFLIRQDLMKVGDKIVPRA